ncbi:ArsR/SmtB family transcription factor [Flexivirga oryzae]|uniref:DNA-binding transcriptional ArsR family regulator n=1 Tax=Flexivirga oryzae TaxID=1794944 RepID=A0A839N5P3_9MICO|nr:helix-turn-helix domain-containing protein [Flexivirga oryzae]MBB2890071.1 DNA-binding transcriptional ArsR family regulator [Flexivirga oryzae]
MTSKRREINRVRPDLAQLKAMAHPVRLTMLTRLRLDGPATASSLAAQLGLNSGATSYHLRQLAEAGLVVEDHGRGNKRDRWWKAAHESTETAPSDIDDVAERAVLMGGYHAVVAQQAAQQIVQAAAEAPELPKEWADLAGASDWNLYLTQDQVRRVKDAVHAIMTETLESSPDRQDAPADAVPFVFQFHTFPRPGTLTHRDGE